jgi:hypothetical protein
MLNSIFIDGAKKGLEVQKQSEKKLRENNRDREEKLKFV